LPPWTAQGQEWGADHDPFNWSPEADRELKILKRKLMEAPALGLPDLSKPFQLYVHERKGVALGVLTQLLGTWKCPVAYFFKQLDQVAKGWPACLQAVAATALVPEEAEKLTLGGTLTSLLIPDMLLECCTLMQVCGSRGEC
uniref:Reverse transcriptase/retrotransposon-derived protein RNase H-like domain-containing protein n=1 Tax=Chelonoidis abingdonii TaxID=106734 RepID=A0A8C0HFI3_CHEAB